MWEDIGGGELLLALGAHVGLYDVEADAQHGVGEAHSQHRGDQNQFTRESKYIKYNFIEDLVSGLSTIEALLCDCSDGDE